MRTLVPHLYGNGEPAVDLAARVEARMLAAPDTVASDLARALDVLGSTVGGFVVTRTPARFSDLPDTRRPRVLEKWGSSMIPQARTIYQAVRKLVLSTWYALPEGRAEIGVRSPLHLRTPVVSWEGPLLGERTLDSEPVARQPAGLSRVPGAHPRPRPIPDRVHTGVSISGNLRLTADVVVIGSGAGGAVAAARLAESGREVVILESGEYLHAPDFTEDEGALAPRLFADQAMRATTDASFTLLQGGAVGGGTTVNWMLMLRPPEFVLDEWARMGITGFSATDLAPHLDRIEEEVHARQAPADAHSPANLAIIEGARRLGWRARAASINARGCVQAGTCSLGCRYDAKQSALLTYLPRAFAAGARLHAETVVDRIEVIERDHAHRAGAAPRKRVHATVRDPRTGIIRRSLTVDAPIVILAAGAVGTPAILERSGLGGGGVGRYLRLHPTTAVMGHYPGETYPLSGIPQTALCDEFLQRDGSAFGFWIECPALQPALAAAALPGFGPSHQEAMRQLANTVAFIVLVRDGAGSERSMGAVWVDRNGHPRIRYRMTPADRVNLQAGIEAAGRLHLAAGATEVMSLHTPPVRVRAESGLSALRAASVAANRVTMFSAHVNGTCRLGVNPATSGVTMDAERHGVRGLHVCDGSLLPTSLGVNPQETIMAMASLVAHRLAAGC